jgi:predicted NUDIX family NTP pyrophosphohydrolase
MPYTEPMETKHSAGLLMFRNGASRIEFFLVHPGGPFFAKKDEGVWTIPKGLIEPGEAAIDVAAREFTEETGRTPQACGLSGELLPLGTIRQRGGKIVEAWGFEGDWPAGESIASNTYRHEWPPSSGEWVDFPEVDRGDFFDLATARRKLNPAQVAFLDRLLEQLERSKP